MSRSDTDDPPIEAERDFVRPFLVTAGRTRSSIPDLRLETLVESTDKGKDDLRFEASAVAHLCDEANSIAEISALLKIPLGTVKVIVGDLVDSGHLRTHRTLGGATIDDLQLVSRLIAGVREL